MTTTTKEKARMRQLVEKLADAICKIYESGEDGGADPEALEQEQPETVGEAASGIHAEFDALFKDTIAKMQSGELPGESNDELHECGYTAKIAELVKKNGGWCDLPLDVFKGAIFDGPARMKLNTVVFVKFPDGQIHAFSAQAGAAVTADGEKSSVDEIINKIKSAKDGNVFVSVESISLDGGEVAQLVEDSEDSGEFEAFGGCWQAEFKFAGGVLQFRELHDWFKEHGVPNLVWDPAVNAITWAEDVLSVKTAGENARDYEGEATYELDEGERITPENGMGDVIKALQNLLTGGVKGESKEEKEEEPGKAAEEVPEQETPVESATVGQDDWAGQIKTVKLGYNGQSVPVSEFKSAAALLKAVYDLGQKAAEDGYYESLQVDFDYDGEGGCEVSFLEIDG